MIKGRATIQIIDEKSGEMVREIHEENMITNAVDTILNPPDYIETGMDAENDRSYNPLRDFLGNLADTAFSGVIVCRDQIPPLFSRKGNGLSSQIGGYFRTAGGKVYVFAHLMFL